MFFYIVNIVIRLEGKGIWNGKRLKENGKRDEFSYEIRMGNYLFYE